ncbi:uncharacterized protein LOC115440968 isoform X3 [Manduca sexta]|uniref:uncharacterized protein LOC115440968 isoform X3 n=1 Tax=Manduca sexta TaxID=7130 RepID=UPI00189021A7|nr:uncharacterized protein LOC115440968 isoform X3 [Manduca sexta]
MPGKIKVKVLAGRNLPVMDRASDTTDAFVEIKFGGVTHKTDVCRKSLNPHWNSTEWYRFEVDESELQDEPLQLRLMDHDTYSANDAIGKVVISLAPLLAREANNVNNTTAPHGGAVMSGWIPVFDTMHGIRGELNVIVKVELFSDFNKYKTSSCGVQFFHCPMIPPGYRATSIHGFVEELVVNDDPEYQWIDKIRTPRASNEARQVAFIKLSNQVQRLVGLKAAELGANAVIGYQQDFDLEGEAGVVARAIGTAVSISPIPTPSQQVNIPPCTQQQLKKYLDILASDGDNITDLKLYYQNHQEELQKLLTILNPNASSLLDEPMDDDDDRSLELARPSNASSYAGSVSLYQDDYMSHKSLKDISEDQTDLNRLLNRRDDYDSDSSGPLQKIKKLKTNLFSKKFSLRSRKWDKDSDQVSLKSNSSDSSRITLLDLKNEFRKLRRIKKPKFRKAVSCQEDEGEGEGMVSILARSVIHAHTSLACIAEKDSDHSPSSTLRRTSESEPTINVVDEEKHKKIEGVEEIHENTKVIPEIHFTSLTNISSDGPVPERQRKISESCPTTPVVGRSENLLKLPGDPEYFGSISSALSGESSEIYSSSDEDDESSDVKTYTDGSFETTSSVVQSVLNHEVDPAIIDQMDKKLSILESATPEPSELKNDDLFTNTTSLESVTHDAENIKTEEIEVTVQEAPSTSKEDTCVNRTSSQYIKLHNPFAHKKASKSISAPSSPTEKTGFVYRSSKRIKNKLSKISKSSMIKSLSHYSLLPKKKVHSTLSNPSSSSDVPSKAPSETVLGSHFLSYSDLLTLDREGFQSHKPLHKSDEFGRSKFSMYIGSEPVSRASLSGTSSPPHKDDHDHHVYKKEKSLKPASLVQTAMETMLIDRVQSLLIPTSPDPASVNTQQFFTDVSEKLEKVEESRNKKDSIGIVRPDVSKAQSLPPESRSPSSKSVPFFDDFRNKKSNMRERSISDHKPPGLLHTAMETILMDKVQTLVGPATPEPINTVPHYEEKYKKDKPKTKAKESSGLVHTAMETMLMEKVQSVLPKSPEIITVTADPALDKDKPKKVEPKKGIKPAGLVQTAMTTMLLEKAQAVLPETPELVVIPEPSFGEDKSVSKGKGMKPSGLVHTAMETMLLEKVQSVLPETPETIPIRTEEPLKEKTEISDVKTGDVRPTGIVHTAMETILIDKVQNLLASDVNVGTSANEHTKELELQKSPSTHSMDKISFTSEKSPSIFIGKGKNNDSVSITSGTSSGLVRTAMETMLFEKVQSVLGPETPEPKSVNIETEKAEKEPKDLLDMKSPSLVKTAMETILMDKAQSLILERIDPVGTKNQDADKTTAKDTEEPAAYVDKAIKNIDKLQSLITESETKASEDPCLVETETNQKKEFKKPKLVRQDSVSSAQSLKMSNDVQLTKPMLQHFHPVLSGAQLETIPSLPESFEHTESSDVSVEANYSVDVCGNLHAVCGVDRDKCEPGRGSPRHARHESYGGKEPVQTHQHAQNSSLNASSTPMGIHRRSSDSDLSVTPKGGSLNTSAGNVGSGGGAILRPSMNSNNLDMLEYPFLTMTEFPPGFIVHIGGTVCARSVKLAETEGGARGAWWAELRTELRAHARALRCNAVVAYADSAAICEDVCVLSASGTAVVINLDCDFNAEVDGNNASSGSKNAIDELEAESCSVAHVPYSPGAGPYRAELSTCGGCRRARVPAVLLATCSKPNKLVSYGKAITLTAVAARVRRAPPAAEPGARDISDQLPFLEYELHKLLLAKLRMQGANALFSLQTQIAVGERCVMALASGTAVRLAALPPPTPPRIKASENDKDAVDIQKALWDSFTANKAANGYDIGGVDHNTNGALPEVDGEDAPALDLCADKDACVLELDEAEDVETARSLAQRRAHARVFCGDMTPRADPPHAFAQVWRARAGAGAGAGGGSSAGAERVAARALDAAAYKLRRLRPCALAPTRFHLELPEDEIQLVVYGTAIPLVDPSKPEPATENGETTNHTSGGGDTDDDIFALDEEQLVRNNNQQVEVEEKSSNGQPPRCVSLSTLSGACGAAATRRICALRLLFVRETTAVRELGGLSGFLHTFTCAVCNLVDRQVLAIVRAYTAALGGNALTSFYITQLMLQDNAHKNQGQCLLSVGGDVVHVTY